MAKFNLILLSVSAFILSDTAAATLNSNENFKASVHQLRKRSNPLDSHARNGQPNEFQGHPSNRRSGFGNDDGPSNEFFHPDFTHSNSYPAFNTNRGSNYGGAGRQNSGGFSSQSSSSFNSQGNSNNQASSQGNSNKKPNQSGGQNSNQATTTGGSSNQGSQSKTTPRPPLNIILNENTLDNSTVRECIQNKCPSTNEYNPVCGDDNITYQNPSKFKCAQFCRSECEKENVTAKCYKMRKKCRTLEKIREAGTEV